MATLDVWNKALGAAHSRGMLSSLTETSPEKDLCERWYESTVRTVQQAAWWPTCKANARLALLSERPTIWVDGAPEPPYQYAYALPANYLRARFLTNYERFSISYSSALNRLMLSTNQEDAVLTYSIYNSSVELWSPDQEMATVYGLAAHISGQLSGSASLVSKNFEAANTLLQTARAHESADGTENMKSRVPWLAARGFYSEQSARYYYPYGNLFAAGVADG